MNRHASAQAGDVAGIRNLPLALAAVLFTLLAIDAICAVLEIPYRAAIQRQVDITAGANVADWFSAGVFVVTGASAMAVARLKAQNGNARLAGAAGWVAVGCALLAMAVAEIAGMSPDRASVTFLVPVAAILLLVFMGHQVWNLHVPRGFLILAFILLLSNPVTEQAKTRLVSNPDNYVFVSNTEPYAFKGGPATRLSLVSHMQEATEIATVLCLLYVFRGAGASSPNRRPSPSGVTSHAALRTDKTRTIP